MICYGAGDKIENYKEYKNRTIKKHLDKAKNQIAQIRSCSLKGEDKQALIKQIIEIIKL